MGESGPRLYNPSFKDVERKAPGVAFGTEARIKKDKVKEEAPINPDYGAIKPRAGGAVIKASSKRGPKLLKKDKD
jgi:hypothetical protein